MMVAPQRIQLQRRRGWRTPEGAIVVARPSEFGNPFPVVASDRQTEYRGGAAFFVDNLFIHDKTLRVRYSVLSERLSLPMECR
jgi:hypothetical protein